MKFKKIVCKSANLVFCSSIAVLCSSFDVLGSNFDCNTEIDNPKISISENLKIGESVVTTNSKANQKTSDEKPSSSTKSKKTFSKKKLELNFDVKRSSTNANASPITDNDKLFWIIIKINNRNLSSDDLFDININLHDNSCLEILDKNMCPLQPLNKKSFKIKKNIKLIDQSEFVVPVQINKISQTQKEEIKILILQNANNEQQTVKSSLKEVFIEHVPNKAIIIVPGIAGSEIFSAKSQLINGTQYAQDHRIWPPEDTSKFIRKNAPLPFKKISTDTESTHLLDKSSESFDSDFDSNCNSSSTVNSNDILDIIIDENESNDNSNSDTSESQDRLNVKLMGVDTNRIFRDFRNLCCDESGNSKLITKKSYPFNCREEGEERFYGAADTYQFLAESLQKEKKLENYKIIFFSYDWRQSNETSASELKQYIDNNGFEDIILISHSMGGLVCTSFLSDEENRENIDKFISLGTPFLGANKAINVVETGEFFDGLIGAIIAPVANDLIKKIVQNCPSVYELFPPKQMFALSKTSVFEESSVVNRFCCFSKTKTKSIRDFSEYSEMLTNKFRYFIPNVNMFMTNAQNFHNTLYRSETQSILSTSSIDFYNIVGVNTATVGTTQISFDSKKDMFGSLQHLQLSDGDGTVTFESATICNTLPQNKLYQVSQTDHIGLVKDRDVISLLKNIINNKPEIFNDSKITQGYH